MPKPPPVGSYLFPRRRYSRKVTKIANSSILAVGIVFGISSSASIADEFLYGEVLQKAFCGKTFYGENVEKGSTFKVYYPEKCNEVILHFLIGGDAGNTVTWRLRISASGDHCVVNGGKEKCARFILNKDGIYQAMRDGKVIYTRSQPVDGDHLNN